MGTGIINFHYKNEMVHFSNELVVIVIRCRSPDIFVIYMGLLLSVQQWAIQLQTGQQEIQLPSELFPLNFVRPFHVCTLEQTTFEIQHHVACHSRHVRSC